MVTMQDYIKYTIKTKGNGGEEGIRTLETGTPPTPLAGERLRPLGHLSVGVGIFKLLKVQVFYPYGLKFIHVAVSSWVSRLVFFTFGLARVLT